MISSFLASVRSLVSQRLRRLFSRPSDIYDQLDEDVFRSHDAEMNERSSPPPEEHIDIRCIWGIEFYTPSHLDDLASRLQELGRHNVGPFRTRSDPVLWLHELSRSRYSGGWHPLGPFVENDGSSGSGSAKEKALRLPPHVSYVHGYIAALSPSLVSISLCFRLDESLSTMINASLHEDRTTLQVTTDGGKSFQDPHTQKQNDFDKTRLELQEEIREWFEEYLPGVLVAGNVDIPTCELITAKVARPYKQRDTNAPDWWSYQRIVGFEGGMDSWRMETVDGLRFDTPRDSWHSLFVANESDLDALVDDRNGIPREASVGYMDLAMGAMLRAWAILPLMEHLTREVATTSAPSNDGPEQTLEALKKGMLSRMDIAALSNELADEKQQRMLMYMEASSQFTRLLPFERDEDDTLAKLLCYRITSQAAWLKVTDGAARESAVQYGALLAAVENIRLQKSVKRLTWALTWLGVAAIVATVVAATCFSGSG